LLGHCLGPAAKFFQQDLLAPEQILHSLYVHDGAQRAAQNQAVETTQDTRDFVSETLYKPGC
jgi:hypothetical protein